MNNNTKYSILVVDDDNVSIDVLTNILSPEYTIYKAENGKDAIEVAERQTPDIILLDILMPEMDGYAVINALKSSKLTQDIPVIFITGLDSDEEEEKGLHLGAADYITKPFSAANVRLRVKKQIENLVQRRRADYLGMTDQLTDLLNKSSFETMLNNEWAKAISDQIPISILYIDLDKFKDYNDSYGHPQGDVALKTLGQLFKETLKRPGDLIARWGGEEFVILLPNTDVNSSIDLAEQVRKKIEEMEIPCVGGLGAKITASIGINTLFKGLNGSLDDFISGADAALFAAKEKGQNTVCHSLAQFTDKH